MNGYQVKAYDIAGYRLDKEGVLHIPEGAEETAKDLILQLRERGFQDDAEITEEVPVQRGQTDNCDSEREPYGYGIGKFTEDYSK